MILSCVRTVVTFLVSISALFLTYLWYQHHQWNKSVLDAQIMTRDGATYEELRRRVTIDLSLPTTIRVTLYRKYDAYYVFAAGDTMNGGGVQLIVMQLPDGSMNEVWSGQDAPLCNRIWNAEFHVPRVITPYCYTGDYTLISRPTDIWPSIWPKITPSWVF